MARKKDEESPPTRSKKADAGGEPAPTRPKAKKAKAAARPAPAEKPAAAARPVAKAAAKRKARPSDPPPASPEPSTESAAVLAAELEVLKAVLTSQQLELENRRSLLEQVEWRERLLSEELELLRGSQQDIAEVRREAAEARGQAADALAQMAEALSQMASAQAHAADAERRLQEMIREAQEAEQTLAGYQDELADLHHELEQAQEWQNDLESELSLRSAQDSEERSELSMLRLENERLERELSAKIEALRSLTAEHSEVLLRLNELDDANTELEKKHRIKELAYRKLEKTLADRAEELAELASLVEEADAREDKLRADHEAELKKLRSELGSRDDAALDQVREQLQRMGARLSEAVERADTAEKELAGANGLLDEVEAALGKGEGLERLRMRLQRLRGGSKVMDELRVKEFEAERRAESAHQEMVSMRARMLEAHNQLELSEIARQRAEQRVAQLEEQLRASTGR